MQADKEQMIEVLNKWKEKQDEETDHVHYEFQWWWYKVSAHRKRVAGARQHAERTADEKTF
jgi:hypothetical protein